MIPYNKQSLDEDDIQAVVNVLRSDFLTQGPVVPAFEKALSAYVGAQHSVACINGSAALHLAMIALGIRQGDIVWTVANTFVATANCALNCGATIDFVDIDPETFNISIAALSNKLAIAEKNGTLPKVLIVVHFAGEPADLTAIKKLSEQYRFKVVEDACHALGASYGGEKVGSCKYSDITVFSFHPVKSITSGEGGALTTNNNDYAKVVRLYANNGITKESELFVNCPHGPWYYEQQTLGYNYRLSDIHAALGLSQLKKIDRFISQRKKLADRYRSLCESLPVRFQLLCPASQSAYHLLVVSLSDVVQRNELFSKFNSADIRVQVHYIPVFTQPVYSSQNLDKSQLKNSASYYSRCLSLPLFVGLSEGELDTVIKSLKEVLS